MPREWLRQERQQRIAEQLRVNGSLRVKDLAARFGASDMTIRRDLADLEAAGVVKRVHGGAIAWKTRTPFGERSAISGAAKTTIARAVAALIEPGECVMFDMGTTSYAVACELADRTGLFLITNAVNTARELTRGRNRVLLVGGFVHGHAPELNIVGEIACETIRRFRADKLILGAGGITLEHGLMYFDVEEVDVRTAMLESARTVIVASDHTKFGREDLVPLTPLSRADVVVTDAPPPDAFRTYFAEHDVRVIVANDEDEEQVTA
ncbi:MAG: DeoR/GlpR transcriptional regulator [Candidatus Eremiobacteraeota bacterium]|nr:DeoR/GlpR transcriptional regulator [Candidatus Eremiobacteraeota bacterium]MBV9409647.1 DeoR/GlpR transcriptional regulator [Candidatus Eremiobacteraeota bacterium]